MSAISQTIFSYAFLWMKSFVFWLKIYIGLDNGLAPNRRWAIIWTNADPIHWRIYAALRGMSLTYDDGGVGVVGGGVGWGWGWGVEGWGWGGEGWGGGIWTPYPPGFNPPTHAQFFPPYPRPLFSDTLAQNSDFLPPPPPIWPPPRTFSKAPYPCPLTPGPPSPLSSPILCLLTTGAL